MPHASDTEPRDWNERYRTGDLPWDTGRPSTELVRVLEERQIGAGIASGAGGRALEIGCGTGTNAVYLATRGFTVTAFDLSPLAIERAQDRARQQGVDVRFLAADFATLDTAALGSFDFVFDRGCYHCVRQHDLTSYLRVLGQVTQHGCQMLLLAGNANEPQTPGPPVVSEEEIRAELGRLFEIVEIRTFRFDNPDTIPDMHPLGWSCFMTRK